MFFVAAVAAAYSDAGKAREIGAAERVATIGQVRENSFTGRSDQGSERQYFPRRGVKKQQ